MKILQKQAGRDFTVLNVTDLHARAATFTDEADVTGRVMRYTMEELISRTHPDLITFGGDMTTDNDISVYRDFVSFMDSFGIPWAPVMGNHDNRCGVELFRNVLRLLKQSENCLFEAGDPLLGCGNYVIGINRGKFPTSALILMDTGSYVGTLRKGDPDFSWGYVTSFQSGWYRSQVSQLKAKGYRDSALFVHIPIYGYEQAVNHIFTGDTHESDNFYVDCPEEFVKDRAGYRFGVNYEIPACPAKDDGMLDAIVETGHTKSVICGHNHINSASLIYRDVCLTYSLKFGNVSHFRRQQNGGTVMRVTDHGITLPEHVYVDVSHLLD